MPGAELLISRTVDLAIQHGQFLAGAVEPGDKAAMLEAFHDALNSRRFVGLVRNQVVVITPAEDSYGTPVTVEVWNARPDNDGDGRWDHEVELDLDLSRGFLLLELTTDLVDTVEGFPTGWYRVQICGGGFTPFLEYEYSGDNVERYRLRLWPRTAPEPLVVTRQWPGWKNFGG